MDVIRSEGGKILLCVLDGLGGIPHPRFGKTELEFARTPNLDKLAPQSSKGFHIPCGQGITPGSGPSHLALFGYDPYKYLIKRGILEALGIGLEVKEGQVTARGNWARCVEKDGKIVVTDRRAGRIPTDVNRKLCEELGELEIDGVRIKVYPVREHRVCVVFEGGGVDEETTDTDPQVEGQPVREPASKSPKFAQVVSKFTRTVFEKFAGDSRANCILLRGFSSLPDIPKFPQKWKLKALSIALYPMYRGLTRILGMDVAEIEGDDFSAQISALERNFEKYDFFYLHFKKTDSAGEDGNFEAKVKAIEEFDSHLPRILKLPFDVIAITGDHSTPSALRSHSWHPVPLLVWSKRCFADGEGRFTERDCARGMLGTIRAEELMWILLANAGRLEKYGA